MESRTYQAGRSPGQRSTTAPEGPSPRSGVPDPLAKKPTCWSYTVMMDRAPPPSSLTSWEPARVTELRAACRPRGQNHCSLCAHPAQVLRPSAQTPMGSTSAACPKAAAPADKAAPQLPGPGQTLCRGHVPPPATHPSPGPGVLAPSLLTSEVRLPAGTARRLPRRVPTSALCFTPPGQGAREPSCPRPLHTDSRPPCLPKGPPGLVPAHLQPGLCARPPPTLPRPSHVLCPLQAHT